MVEEAQMLEKLEDLEDDLDLEEDMDERPRCECCKPATDEDPTLDTLDIVLNFDLIDENMAKINTHRKHMKLAKVIAEHKESIEMLEKFANIVCVVIGENKFLKAARIKAEADIQRLKYKKEKEKHEEFKNKIKKGIL